MIDLHSHTTASDGEHPPTELVRRACAAGVTTLAVTDHDTVAAIPEALEAASRDGLRLIPGIELTAFFNDAEVHLLGHFVDPGNDQLGTVGARLRTGRRDRMEKMIAKLAALGIAIDMAEVEALSGSENLRRPHLARVLVQRGHAADVSDAFKKFLARDRPAFVEHPLLQLRDAIALVKQATGTATVAHPGVSRLAPDSFSEMKDWGLSGVEVFHSDHEPAERDRWLALARRLDLVATAGSDFHGETVTPGRKLGGVGMEPADLARLESRRG